MLSSLLMGVEGIHLKKSLQVSLSETLGGYTLLYILPPTFTAPVHLGGGTLLLSLIQLEALLSRLCCTCEAAYRVLHWENPTVSSQFYGALLGTICMLYLLPLCWVLALLNSTLFLGNVEFFRVVSEYRASLQRRMNPKQEESAFESPPPSDAGGKGALGDCTPAPTPTEDLTPGSVEEAEEAEPDEEFKDAIEETHLVVLEDDEGAPCPAEDELVLQDNGFLSKNEVLRSKVSRLTERLRKRYPTNNLGSCTGCSATFSVLKKRRNCSNCGNSFCSRCCSFKVPRSSMGATGAAATSDRALKSLGCGLSSPARRPYQHRGQHSDRLQDLGARRPTRPQALESAASASAPRTAPGPRSRRRQPTCSRSQQRQHPSSTGPAAGSERSAPPEHGH
ncbi:protrudin isoform X8 [Odocoileus virginianus]|uniref:Protrudin n=1 Tax=Odocoileus virginianus TaxID=9874 RepID=A0ABM4IE44_ODOVR